MNLRDFSLLNNVNTLIPLTDYKNYIIDDIALVSSPGNMYWVKENDFVLIASNFINQDDFDIILKHLIGKNILGCCIVSPTSLNQENINICLNYNLPIFEYQNFDTFSSFFRILSSSTMKTRQNAIFAFEQVKHNLICLMNSEYYTLENITHLCSFFYQRSVYILSDECNIISHSTYFTDIDTESIPLNDWYNQLQNFNEIASYSLEPVLLNGAEKPYLCFPLKTGSKILGYIAIEEKHPLWGNLNVVSFNELLPFFLIAMINHLKINSFQRKSFEEYLQSALYKYYKDENSLKRDSTNFNFKYDENRFVWILQATNLNSSKKVDPKDLNKIIQRAKNIAVKYFYKSEYIIEEDQLISIQIKDNAEDNERAAKYNNIINQLELEYPEYNFSVGFSRAYNNFSEIYKGYEDAMFSNSIGKIMFKNSKNLFYYNDLLVYHLVYNQVDNPIMKRLYTNTIKKLMKHDIQKNDTLLPTLTELVNYDFNYKETSDVLFIHRNTLYQRITKIESIVEMSLKKSETKLLLQLGIKYHNIAELYKQ